jgi:hypothetical protein
MTLPRLAIVIHAEEEFDWSGDFKRSNRAVSHGRHLIHLVERILATGAKVTLAMDHPFVTSPSGKNVVNHFKSRENKTIEFAAHLHPWVNPPFESDLDIVENIDSYPGNLTEELERNKLNALSLAIKDVTGNAPTTYLAGRYGIGENSPKVLRELGFKVDLSISAYCDFQHQDGPDFSHYTNKTHIKDDIQYIAHTGSIVSIIPFISDYFNQHPSMFSRWHENRLKRILLKILRVKRYRLSPEGFQFTHLKNMTEKQRLIGQEDFVLSFQSPSSKPGCTPYVRTDADLKRFESDTINYIHWFKNQLNGDFFLPNEHNLIDVDART